MPQRKNAVRYARNRREMEPRYRQYADGLAALWLFERPTGKVVRGWVSGYPFDFTAGSGGVAPKWDTDAIGPHVVASRNGDSSGIVLDGHPILEAFEPPTCSLLWWAVNPVDNGEDPRYFSIQNDGAGANHDLMGGIEDSGAGYKFRMRLNTGAGGVTHKTAASFTAGDRQFVGCDYDGAEVRIYLDGLAQGMDGGDPSTQTGDLESRGFPMKLLNSAYPGGDNSWAAPSYMGAVYARSLPAAMHQELARGPVRPWHRYRPLILNLGAIAVSQTSVANWESLASPSQSVLAFHEADGVVTAPVLVNWESLAGVLQGEVGVYEALSGVTGTQALNYEALALAVQTVLAFHESQGQVAAPVLTNWESLAGLFQTSVAKWEAQAGVTASEVAAYESLAGVVQTVLANWESLAAVGAVSQSEVMVYESLAGVTEDVLAFHEAEGQVAQALVAFYEALAAVSQAKGANWESLAGVTASEVAVYEALAGINQTIVANWESLAIPGTLSQASIANYEALAGVLQTLIASHEADAFPALGQGFFGSPFLSGRARAIE